jgi:hypothetical protein
VFVVLFVGRRNCPCLRGDLERIKERIVLEERKGLLEWDRERWGYELSKMMKEKNCGKSL